MLPSGPSHVLLSSDDVCPLTNTPLPPSSPGPAGLTVTAERLLQGADVLEARCFMVVFLVIAGTTGTLEN